MKQGFTLIELLVVVLIIGILAAVALPQYQKAVEKSRLAEALSNIKIIENNFKLFLLENGHTASVCLKDMGSAGELAGGTWTNDKDCTYITPHFKYYSPFCKEGHCTAEISKLPNYDYTLVLDNRNANACFTQDTELGRFICKSLESSGWEYMDNEY